MIFSGGILVYIFDAVRITGPHCLREYDNSLSVTLSLYGILYIRQSQTRKKRLFSCETTLSLFSDDPQRYSKFKSRSMHIVASLSSYKSTFPHCIDIL